MRKSAAKAAALDDALVSEPAPPITERIAAAVASEELVPSSTWEALRTEASAALTDISGKEQRARQAAGDLSIPAASARFARDEADDLLHEARRIQAAIDKIDEILPHVRAMEHRAAIMPTYLAFKAERAEFIERLRDRWPKLAAEMVELLREIERYRQQPGVEIPEGEDPLRGDVELEARSIPMFSAGMPEFAFARIPNFAGDPHMPFLWTEYFRGARW